MFLYFPSFPRFIKIINQYMFLIFLMANYILHSRSYKNYFLIFYKNVDASMSNTGLTIGYDDLKFSPVEYLHRLVNFNHFSRQI